MIVKPALQRSPPSPWVARFAPLIGAGEVLDLACGTGRHAALLAQLGHPVLAADRDPDALRQAAGEGISTFAWDFEDGGQAWPFAEARFAAIVIANYLHRPLWPQIVASLAPQGLLIVDTFALGNAAFGRPANPDFLLRPGELLSLPRHCPPPDALHILAFEDGYTDTPRAAMVQRVCALKIAAASGADLPEYRAQLRLNT
jgi:SAM-dependent methyltransferase